MTIWDADSWAEIRTLIGHEGFVESVAFSLDGKRLVSGGRDNNVKVWDVEKGTEIATLRRHVAEVLCVAVSPNGKLVASGGKDNSIRLLDSENGVQLFVLPGHNYWISSLAFNPDGRCLVSGSGSLDSDAPAQLKIWDLANGQELRGIELPKGGVTSVAFSPDVKRIAAAIGHGTPSTTNAFGEAKVWDVETGAELVSLVEGGTSAVSCVTFSPDGRRIVTSSLGGSLRFWDAGNGAERHRIEYAGVQNVVFSRDGKNITAWGGWHTRDIGIWDAREESLAQKRGYEMINSLVVVRPTLIGADPPKVAGQPDAVRCINPPDLEMVGQPLMTLKGHVGTVTAVAFSPDGKRGISASYDTPLIVWDIDSGKELLSIDGQAKYGRCLNVRPDGKFIVSGGRSPDDRIKLSDAVTGNEIRTINATASCLALSPDGKRIVFQSL